MRTLKIRLALAAALAATSVPALAGDFTCSVCDDPTWPKIENPAPPIVVTAGGDETEAIGAADPTWPEASFAFPGISLELPSESVVERHNPVSPDENCVDGLGRRWWASRTRPPASGPDSASRSTAAPGGWRWSPPRREAGPSGNRGNRRPRAAYGW